MEPKGAQERPKRIKEKMKNRCRKKASKKGALGMIPPDVSKPKIDQKSPTNRSKNRHRKKMMKNHEKLPKKKRPDSIPKCVFFQFLFETSMFDSF